jgi:hypothetical protein
VAPTGTSPRGKQPSIRACPDGGSNWQLQKLEGKDNPPFSIGSPFGSSGWKQRCKRDRWLYWFLHAHEYEPEALLALFPEAEMQLATITLARITEITEDKKMYDAREKALRDQQWALNAAHREGEIEGEIKGKIEGKIEGEMKGEIKLIRTLEGILGLALSSVEDLQKLDLEALQMLTSNLQERARNRV